jgi:hypothetical protein
MKYIKAILSLLLILLVVPSPVCAQNDQPELRVVLVRNFGYGGFGKIQGRFTVKLKDPPEGLKEVKFYLDDELVHEVGIAPYEYKFHTGDFEEGEHTIFVTGVLTSGVELDSDPISKVFLSSEQAWSETQGLIIPLLLFTAILTLIGTGAPLLGSRKRDFRIGRYGAAGGAVCPRCEFPFSRSIFSPNLLVGKLVRCPHCGKISLLARASSKQLQEAQARYLNQDPSLDQTPEERDFLNQLDESRFED